MVPQDSDWEENQRKVLFQVFEDLGADKNLADFLAAAPCDHGLLTCNDQGEVTELALSGRFGGKVSEALARLPHLEVIDLSRNALRGSIPRELGRLQHLHTLYLNSNELTGRIPKELGNLSALVGLDLGANELEGEIPAELGAAADLSTLTLARNRLTGGLPPELGQLRSLMVLSLTGNQLSGEIPRQLGQLEHLQVLSLAWNQLEGRLPPELGNLRMLEYMNLDDNDFVGEIPKELGELEHLEHLLLSRNQLTGSIPKEFGKLQKLASLSLNENQLTGSIPLDFSTLKSLRILKLHQNQLTGTISAELSELQDLQKLLLFHNRLTGKIPPELGRLKALQQLSLYDNRLEGPVPPQLAELSELRELLLGQNRLEGNIPTLQLEHLQVLEIDQNKLTGKIPKELLQLKGLRTLRLSENRLGGHIPQELGQMNLTKLYLERNQFTGQIPWSLGQLKDLRILRLDNNQLTEEIPECIWQLPRLEALHLAGNRLRGTVPPLEMQSLQVLDLRGNFLRGELPHFGQTMKSLHYVDFSENVFVGPVAAFVESLCDCCGAPLEQLRLSHNKLTGALPPCLLKLKHLTHLALNNNRLSGFIPEINATDLVVLTLHENALTGSLPQLRDLQHLAVLTLHDNSLDGQISELRLRGPCIDNPNFRVRGVPCLGLRQLLVPLHNTEKDDWYSRHDNYSSLVRSCDMALPRFQYSGDELKAILENCPHLCRLCEKYQTARATFHHNRFSCEVPNSISNTADIYATVVMGNMLGHGRDLGHVSWIAGEENQVFLYYSPEIWRTNVFLMSMMLVLALLAVVCHKWLHGRFDLALRCLSSGSTSRVAASNLALLRAAASAALICGPLLLTCLAATGYHMCAPPLSQMTIANLREDDFGEFAVILFWSCTTLLFHCIVDSMPASSPSGEAPKAANRGDSRRSIFSFDSESHSNAVVLDFRRGLAWLLWIILVSIFSLPSILFAVAQALPAKNTSGFSEDVLNYVHRMAPFLIVAIDMFLASPLSHLYSGLTGIKADRLLMTFRLFAAWLLSLLTTVFLHENCFAGWKWFWSVCEKGHPDHQFFNWYIWDEQILDTEKDMCQLRERWWAGGRCSRSIVENLNALMLKKLLIRCTVQPLVLLLLWRFSPLEDEDTTGRGATSGRHLRLCGKGPKISGSLVPLQQMAFITTFMETLFFWSPLVPLISVGVICIAAANLFLFDVGVWSFQVQMPSTAIHQRPAVSRSYLTFSLAASCSFQLWHVFGTQMCGRYLLLALNLALLLPVKRWMLPVERARSFFWGEMIRANEAEVIELAIQMDLS